MSAVCRPVVALALALALGACAAPGPAPPNPTPPGILIWGPCPAGASPNTRCADLPVPLDRAQPHGPRIDVRVSWTPAADPVRRRGVLVANPGGPGSPGLRNAAAAARPSPNVAAALATYDLVGFDPRGVGLSAAVSCGLTPEERIAVRAPTPSPAGPAHDAAIASSTAAKCARAGGPLVAHMSTADVAADLDDVRTALGLPTFSFYGSSYGTYLGVVYDALFPGHLDRVVLDSLVDSQHGWFAQTRLTARTTERRFDDFAAWAAARDAELGLGASPAAVRDRYLALTAALQRRPAGITVDGALVRRAAYALVGRNRFPELAAFLRCAGGPTDAPCTRDLAAAADRLGDEADDAATSAYLAVTCSDSPWPRDHATYARAASDDAARFPVTAGGFGQAGPCAWWPYPARPAVTASTRPGAPQFLLLNNTRDRISDLGGALATRSALGSRARFTTVQGWNHQILGNHDPCADALVAAWLGEGRLPAGDAVCPPPG